MDATTDMELDLKGLVRTGFFDFGTFNRKTCHSADFQVRRSAETGDAPTDPRIEYRFRDTLGAWSASKIIPLGGTYQPINTFWSQGQFRQRQHEISFTNAGNFTLTGATLTYTAAET